MTLKYYTLYIILLLVEIVNGGLLFFSPPHAEHLASIQFVIVGLY